MKLYTLKIHDVCFRVSKTRVESSVDANIEEVYQNFIDLVKEEYNVKLSQLEEEFIENTFKDNLMRVILNFIDSYDDDWLKDTKNAIYRVSLKLMNKINCLKSELINYDNVDFVTLEDEPISNSEVNNILIEYENSFEESNKESISTKIVEQFNEDDYSMTIKGIRIPIRLNDSFFENSLSFEIDSSFYYQVKTH